MVNLQSLNPAFRYISTLLRENEQFRARNDFDAHNLMIERIKHYFGRDFFNRKLNIVDLGCGKHFPLVFLFAMDGHRVIGVDKSYIVQYPSLKSYALSMKVNGLLDTARYFQLDLMRDRSKYYNMLKSLRKGESQTTNMTFIQDDAEKLTKIEDKSADLVVSKDMFEHIKYPDKVVKRISQVLRIGGVCIHIIHLFTSISGGHNPQWGNFQEFEPWDHLRKEKFVLPGYINKLRASDYIKMFKEYFSTVFFEYHSFSRVQASELLTEEIWHELTRKYQDLRKFELLNEKLVVITKRD